MTENNNDDLTVASGSPVYAAPPNRLSLADGSVWGSEEITDLRTKYLQIQGATAAEVANYREVATRHRNDLITLQARVRDAFRELVDEEGLDIDKANEQLEGLGLEKLAVEYEWNATVELRGYGKAPDEDALHSAIEHAGFTIEAYDDGVEDVEVDEADVTSVSSDRVR